MFKTTDVLLEFEVKIKFWDVILDEDYFSIFFMIACVILPF